VNRSVEGREQGFEFLPSRNAQEARSATDPGLVALTRTGAEKSRQGLTLVRRIFSPAQGTGQMPRRSPTTAGSKASGISPATHKHAPRKPGKGQQQVADQ
jgi:hypothetical protein